MASLTVNVLGAYDQAFNGGANYPAGRYVLTYASGAMKYNQDFDWARPTVVITDHAGNSVTWLGSPSPTGYVTVAACEAGEVGKFVYFDHVGGAISLMFSDNPYTDNVSSAPGPTYSLGSLRRRVPAMWR